MKVLALILVLLSTFVNCEDAVAIKLTNLNFSGNIHKLVLSDDNTHLGVTSYDSEVKIYLLEDYSILDTYLAQDSSSLDYPSDNNSIAVGTISGTVYIYHNTGGAPWSDITLGEAVQAIKFNNDSTRMAVCGATKFQIWTSTERTSTKESDFTGLNSCQTIAFSNDGNKVAIGNGNDIAVYDISNNYQKTDITSGAGENVTSIVYNSDDSKIIAGFEGGDILIFNTADSTVSATIQGHSSTVNQVAISPEGSVFASASDDSTIVFWDSEDNSELLELTDFTSAVKSISFNSNGRFAAGGDDQKIIVWDVAEFVDVGGSPIKSGSEFGSVLDFSVLIMFALSVFLL